MKTEVLTRAEAAVAAVERKLLTLNDLEKKAGELSEAIEGLVQEESELLASEQDEQSKIKALLKLRATADVKRSSVAKIRAEIGATTDEIRLLGGKAELFLGAIRDALLLNRKQRIGAEIKSHFVKNAWLEIDRLLSAANLVREIDEIPRLFFPANHMDTSIDSARKVRSQLDLLSSYVTVEPNEFEIIASESW
jgi:hypothetical protein